MRTLTRHRTAVACGVGLCSEVFPIPGALLAALFYQEGIHSSSPNGFLVLTFLFNFLLFAGAAFAILTGMRSATSPTGQ